MWESGNHDDYEAVWYSVPILLIITNAHQYQPKSFFKLGQRQGLWNFRKPTRFQIPSICLDSKRLNSTCSPISGCSRHYHTLYSRYRDFHALNVLSIDVKSLTCYSADLYEQLICSCPSIIKRTAISPSLIILYYTFIATVLLATSSLMYYNDYHLGPWSEGDTMAQVQSLVHVYTYLLPSTYEDGSLSACDDSLRVLWVNRNFDNIGCVQHDPIYNVISFNILTFLPVRLC